MHEEPNRPPPPNPTTEVGELTPIAPQERLGTLDFLRGTALFGILMVNLPLFGFPLMIGFGGPDLLTRSASERFAWWVGTVGFQWSFISLFSLLFGAGFVMMSERAATRGASIVGPYLRRCAMLMGFGLLHVTLLWMGDILFAYGILALPLLALGWLRVKALVIVGIALLVVGAALTSGVTALQAIFIEMAEKSSTAGTEQPQIDEGLRGMKAMIEARFDVSSPTWIEAETAAHVEGPFLDAMLFRVTLWTFALLSGILTYGWHVLGFFFIGAALMKAGFFGVRDDPDRFRGVESLMIALIPVGLLLKAAYAYVWQSGGWDLTLAVGLLSGVQMIGASLVTLGLVGAGCRLVRSGAGAVPVGWIMRAGRMPLTLYLMQSVICVAIMDHWGLARFGTVERTSMIALTVGIWAGQVVFANLWFSTFRIGPLEWIWRLGTYLRAPNLMR